eukprot:5061707-Pyramimonas_sp.AAC.1
MEPGHNRSMSIQDQLRASTIHHCSLNASVDTTVMLRSRSQWSCAHTIQLAAPRRQRCSRQRRSARRAGSPWAGWRLTCS